MGTAPPWSMKPPSSWKRLNSQSTTDSVPVLQMARFCNSSRAATRSRKCTPLSVKDPWLMMRLAPPVAPVAVEPANYC